MTSCFKIVNSRIPSSHELSRRAAFPNSSASVGVTTLSIISVLMTFIWARDTSGILSIVQMDWNFSWNAGEVRYC